MENVKKHCSVPVMVVSDFGGFFFMCKECGMISNSFVNENPDDIALRRIQFRKYKRE